MQMLQDGASLESMETLKQESVLELGENMVIREAKVIDGKTFGAYVHSNGKLAAVVVSNTSADEAKMKQVAMHVTAANPEYLSPNDISEEVVEKEKTIQLEVMKNDPKMTGKPDEVLLKIIEGKMGKFKGEISLLEQAFVIDPSVKVKDFIGADTLSAFYRFSI